MKFKPMLTKTFWGQTIKESDSGKTWELTIAKAFWDGTVGINKKLVDEACKNFTRRLKIKVLDKNVEFTVPAVKVKINRKYIYERTSKFSNGSPMTFYMYSIPYQKLQPKYEEEPIVGGYVTDKGQQLKFL